MKKVLLPILSLTTCLFLFAFSPSDSEFSYQEIDQQNDQEIVSESGDFSEFETTRYTSDKTEWNHRRKTWTDLAALTDLNTIQTTINNN